MQDSSGGSSGDFAMMDLEEGLIEESTKLVSNKIEARLNSEPDLEEDSGESYSEHHSEHHLELMGSLQECLTNEYQL